MTTASSCASCARRSAPSSARQSLMPTTTRPDRGPCACSATTRGLQKSMVKTMVAWITDPFFSAKLRIERANEHLDVLSKDFDQFLRKNPGEYVAEPNAAGVHTVYKIKFRERFPIKWRVIATEIIEHSRSSLDQATYVTFCLATGQANSNFVAFPFGKTVTDLDNSVKGRRKDLPRKSKRLFDASIRTKAATIIFTPSTTSPTTVSTNLLPSLLAQLPTSNSGRSGPKGLKSPNPSLGTPKRMKSHTRASKLNEFRISRQGRSFRGYARC